LLRFLARAAGEDVEKLDGRRAERNESVELVDVTDGVDHRLARQHLIGRRSGGRGRFEVRRFGFRRHEVRSPVPRMIAERQAAQQAPYDARVNETKSQWWLGGLFAVVACCIVAGVARRIPANRRRRFARLNATVLRELAAGTPAFQRVYSAESAAVSQLARHAFLCLRSVSFRRSSLRSCS